MGGPSTHGQHNKAHKAGRHAGKSARDKHQLKKQGGAQRQSIKAANHAGKGARANASKQLRDAKRQELKQRRRTAASAPLVVALLPLSDLVDAQRLWEGLVAAAELGLASQPGSARHLQPGTSKATDSSTGMDVDAGAGGGRAMAPRTLLVQGRQRLRLTLLPPPADRADPLAYVELGRTAELLVLAMPGGEDAVATLDMAGEAALRVLSALGLPTAVGVVQAPAAGGGGGGSAPNLKARSAAKRRCEKALSQYLSADVAGRLFHADGGADFQQLLRHIADASVAAAAAPPLWRQQRPSLMVEAAAYLPTPASGAASAAGGVLQLTGFVRGQALSANQVVTLPGVGDFQLMRIEGPPDPTAPGGGGGGGGDVSMAGGEAVVLAEPDPEQQEQVVVENDAADALDGEQTWPTEAELQEAQLRQTKRRRLPPGTSDYQAAWIIDSEDDEDEDDDGDVVGGGDNGGHTGGGGGGGSAVMAVDGDALGGGGGAGAPDAVPLSDDGGEEGGGEEAMALDSEWGGDDDETEEDEGRMRQLHERLRAQRQAEADDAMFPDEFDVPPNVAARIRLQKFRGLKSFRTSPWDAREGTPAEYARVFAFENFKRTQKRALAAQAASAGEEGSAAVAPGTYVRLWLSAVPAAVGEAVLSRVAAAACGTAPPLAAFGLLQHETKLSVVNFAVKKAAGCVESVANKEPLLLVTGLRTWMARPLLSSDEHGADKHKMERFLHAGRHAVATVYAPISYPPLPLLAFKPAGSGAAPGEAAGSEAAGGVDGVPRSHALLAATGSLRDCNPDRVVLKKIVLTGFPVRVHKTKGVVRFMFHNPDDVRWFRPLELWTKAGRRGRITEPLGTHGAMKVRFDGPLQQRELVCMNLYKRVFPKWPQAVEAVPAS